MGGGSRGPQSPPQQSQTSQGVSDNLDRTKVHFPFCFNTCRSCSKLPNASATVEERRFQRRVKAGMINGLLAPDGQIFAANSAPTHYNHSARGDPWHSATPAVRR